MNLCCLVAFHNQSNFLQVFGLWATDLFQEEPDTTKEMQSRELKAICKLDHGTGHNTSLQKKNRNGKQKATSSGREQANSLTGFLQARRAGPGAGSTNVTHLSSSSARAWLLRYSPRLSTHLPLTWVWNSGYSTGTACMSRGHNSVVQTRREHLLRHHINFQEKWVMQRSKNHWDCWKQAMVWGLSPQLTQKEANNFFKAKPSLGNNPSHTCTTLAFLLCYL